MTAEELIGCAIAKRKAAGLSLKVTFPDGHVWTGHALSSEQLAKWKASADRQGATWEPIQ